MDSYWHFIQRNIDYIPAGTQEKIRRTKTLIAGCGMGSYFAEAAVRVGYERFILADHDIVELHNLNRQAYAASDVGSYKAEALAARMRAINPNVDIEIIADKITEKNAVDLVSRADTVFDTIDFVDLGALVALHDACTRLNKPVTTAVNAGFGSVCLHFPAVKQVSFRQMFDLPATGSVADVSYGEKYVQFINKIASLLDPSVLDAFYKTVQALQDGRTCPASQVAPGAMTVAALATTIAVRVTMELPVVEAPNVISCNLSGLVAGKGAAVR